jgi:hypothetical protein
MKTIGTFGVWGAGNRISIRLDNISSEAPSDIAGRRSGAVVDLLVEIDRERRLGVGFRRHPQLHRGLLSHDNAGSIARRWN